MRAHPTGRGRRLADRRLHAAVRGHQSPLTSQLLLACSGASDFSFPQWPAVRARRPAAEPSRARPRHTPTPLDLRVRARTGSKIPGQSDTSAAAYAGTPPFPCRGGGKKTGAAATHLRACVRVVLDAGRRFLSPRLFPLLVREH